MTTNQLALCLLMLYQRKLNTVAVAHEAAMARLRAKIRSQVAPYVEEAA